MASSSGAMDKQALISSAKRPHENVSEDHPLKKIAKENVFLNDDVVEPQESPIDKVETYFSTTESEENSQILTPELVTQIPVLEEQPENIPKKHLKRKKTGKRVKKNAFEKALLDKKGVPVFPVRLGDLTVRSLGQFHTDEPCCLSENLKVRVGFLSERIYADLDFPDKYKCVYRCKVLAGDDPDGPLKFQIFAGMMAQPIEGGSATECHLKLIAHMNLVLGNRSIIMPTSLGPVFFGFAHPEVLKLISPELYNTPQNEEVAALDVSPGLLFAGSSGTEDPSISFDALQRGMPPLRLHFSDEPNLEPQDIPTEFVKYMLGSFP